MRSGHSLQVQPAHVVSVTFIGMICAANTRTLGLAARRASSTAS